MILSFVDIRKVPREMLKTSGFALGFQHLLGTLRFLMNGKSYLIPTLLFNKNADVKAYFFHFQTKYLTAFRNSSKWHLPRSDATMVIWTSRAIHIINQLSLK